MPCKALEARSRVGRTVQVHVRAAVRPNQAACRRKRQFLGTCSRPQSPSACGTQAKYLLPGRAAFERRKLEVAPPFALSSSGCPVPKGAGRRVPIACRHTWRRGRGETPGVPHAPLGEEESKSDRPPEPEWKRGDDARLLIARM